MSIDGISLRALAALAIAVVSAAPAPARQRPALTVDAIMRGPALYGYEPRDVRWSGDGRRVYFAWKRYDEPQEKDFDTYIAEVGGGAPRRLSEDEAREAPPANGERSRDGRLAVYAEKGDVFVYDLAAGARRRVTDTVEAESDPHFTFDQRSVYFTRANNLFVMPLDAGSVAQLTDVAGPGGDAAKRGGEEKKGTDSQELLKKQERELLDVVKRRAQKREEEEARKKREQPRKPFVLTAKQSIQRLQLAPDGKSVIALVEERDDAAKRAVVPSYVTESAYTEDIPARTKVGDVQPRTRLVVLDVATGEARWVETARSSEPGAGSSEKGASQASAGVSAQTTEPQAQRSQQPEQSENQSAQQGEAAKTTDRAPSSKLPAPDLYLPVWSDDGTRAAVIARSADNKDRWVLALDPATGTTRELFEDHDDAWVGGPGMFTLGWLPDSRSVFFQSERDGFSHVYTVASEGGAARQLTSGRWEASGVRLSDDKSKFYLTTNEADPGERHVYAMGLDGGARTRLTSMPGNNQVTPSPDGTALAVINSFANRPPELYVVENRPGATAARVTTSPAPDFEGFGWIEPPVVRFKARDGVMVPARLYKPKNFKKGGPAVVFVHGAGYLQNAHRWWSYYAREYMFHHLLMERGYLVLDVDYRGSAGYGRDWRTAIYENMGGPDLDDHVDAARWLAAEHGVAPGRIGIYGGSYGGFITLMAMFRQPGVFAAGAALRPVTDWAHYNHPYTSNILDLPQENLEVYKKTSPIYHAEGLRGALLICHGMVDVNVHFQDSVRLAQRLIELRKENWELAAYPVEDHNFAEPTSWADEYKRILKLFESNLKK